MTRELWKELENSACFHELFNACQQRENDDEHQQIAKLCLLATCCRFVEVSRDDVDASEACLEVEERETSSLMTLAPRFFAAISKLDKVRVEFSKKAVIMVLPFSVCGYGFCLASVFARLKML